MLGHVLLSVIEIVDDNGRRRWSAAETLRTPESAEAGQGDAAEPKPAIRLTLKVSDPVYERLSLFCVRRRTNKQAVLTEALLRYLDEKGA